MESYEIDYLIPADISESERSALNEEIQSLIKKEAGVVKKFVISSEKKLAYPIEGKLRAFITTITFDLEKGKLSLIIKAVKDKKEIIRHLVLKKKEIREKTKRKSRKDKEELTKIVKPTKEKKDKVELKEIEEKLEKILHE